MTQPTSLDIANAENRAQIASKALRTYQEAQAISREALGRGYRPWMRITVVPGDYHTGNSTPVAVAYKMYCGERKTSDNSMFVRRMPDGTAKAAKTYEELFGELLTELDPVRTIEIKGQVIHPCRYCVTWGAVGLYEPQSAEKLAAARAVREKNAVQREAEAAPLFSHIIQEEGFVKNKRKR